MAKKTSAVTNAAPAPAHPVQEAAPPAAPAKETPGLARYTEIGRFLPRGPT
jgi:hypothetical protein